MKRGKVVDAPPPAPPRDWFHYNARQAEALDRMERRLQAAEERVADLEKWVGAHTWDHAKTTLKDAQDA